MRGGYRLYSPQAASGKSKAYGNGARAPVFTHPALTIWSDEPFIPLGDRGGIIGHLFTRELPSRRVDRFDGEALDRIFTSGGRSLLTDYWGGYLLALISTDGDATVMRDPSGLLPCYLRRDQGGVILADDIAELSDRSGECIDFVEVARYLASGDTRGRATGVAGVEELIAGECLRISPSSIAIESWWSPWDFVKPPKGMNSSEAAAQLRAVALDCIGAWASCFDNILLGVSGGLDSSIVAAGSHRRTNLRCLTLVGPDVDGDERRYACQLTEAFDLPLIEARYDLADVDIARPVAPRRPWPNASYFRQAIKAIHKRVEREYRVDAHFTGNGGDGIFCSVRSAVPFLDRFLTEGPRPQLAATLRDLCELTGADATTVLRHAWRKYRSFSKRFTPRYNALGLEPDSLARIQASGPRHPWFAGPIDTLPGKMAHVAFLMRAQRSLELYPRRTAPPHIAPLLSQPIIEFCLSIPTWYWVDTGRDRAVARDAFAGLLPRTLLQRTHKGGPGGFSRAIYDRWGFDLRERLRNGRLAAAGIIAPSMLDEPDDPSRRDTERSDRILSLGAAEAWVDWWSGDRA